jgi:hypothetical protein
MLFGVFNIFSQTVEQREEFFRLLNEERAKHGLDSITYEPLADSAADYRLNSICSCLDTLSEELYEEDYKNYFHYGFYKDVDSINRNIFPIDFGPKMFGECVYEANFLNNRPPLYPKLVKDSFYGWMDSHYHRELLMNGQLKYGGIRIKKCTLRTIVLLVMYEKGYLTEDEIKEVKERRKREGRL